MLHRIFAISMNYSAITARVLLTDAETIRKTFLRILTYTETVILQGITTSQLLTQ